MVNLLKIIKIDYFFHIYNKMSAILDTDVLGVIVSFLNITEDKNVYKSIGVIYNLTNNESSKVLDYWLANSKVECKTNIDGSKYWYVNGKLHRDNDIPAVEDADGSKHWWVNGKRHRENDLPAVEQAGGTKYWYVNGKLHRDNDMPAIEYADGTKIWYLNNKLHRDNNLPAVEQVEGRKEWWVNGEFIRYIRC